METFKKEILEKVLSIFPRAAEAMKWLGDLRDGRGNHDSSLRFFRREVEKGKLSLSDLGTSEAELEKLTSPQAE